MKKHLKKVLEWLESNKIPSHLKKNQINLSNSQYEKIYHSLEKNFYKGWRDKKNYDVKIYNKDLYDHWKGRIEINRKKYIPFLANVINLKGCKILEIGCGTGSSTIALAEQGGKVTGVDIDKDAITVAIDRCKIYNLNVDFINCNAIEIFDNKKNNKFDLVIFFATLEHMTYEERIVSLRKCWERLGKGQMIAILETPNRLWYFDHHTSHMPFNNWIPDRLAFDYAKFSPKNNFKELYNEYSEELFLHFLRRGRGFSFHELEIAFNISAKDLNIVGHRSDQWYEKLRRYSLKNKYKRIIRKINPNIHKSFFYSHIDIVLKK